MREIEWNLLNIFGSRGSRDMTSDLFAKIAIVTILESQYLSRFWTYRFHSCILLKYSDRATKIFEHFFSRGQIKKLTLTFDLEFAISRKGFVLFFQKFEK